MRLVVFLGLIAAAAVHSAPHGTAQTHAPKLNAPDSESVIKVDGEEQSMQAMHHSDMHLGGTIVASNEKPPVVIADSNSPGSDVHHSDTYMMGTSRHAEPEVTTVAVERTTKAEDLMSVTGREDSSRVGSGSSIKSIISHSPMKSLPEHLVNSGGDVSPDAESVLSHGPMAKNVGHLDKSHETRVPLPDKTNIHHAPIAGNHPPKVSNVHHPSLSKVDSVVSAGAPSAHSPMVHVHVDDSSKHEKKVEDEEEATPVSPVRHAPLATEHHAPKLAHHPSLSKGEVVPPGAAHAPFAIPGKHSDEKIHIEKKSVKIDPPTSKSAADGPEPAIVKPAAHHPFLSKTEPVAPFVKVDVPSQEKPSRTVSSTTEISGNFLEARQIIPGSHPLAILPPLTQSPPS